MEEVIFTAYSEDGTKLSEVSVKPETSGAAIIYIYGNWHSPDNLNLIADSIREASTYLRSVL